MNKLVNSFAFALKGIRMAVGEQRNLKIHLAMTLLVVVAGIYFAIPPVEWCIVVFAIGLVWVAEMMNTAIEKMVDLVEPKQNPLAGKVKDIAAGGVLAAAICSMILGLIVFFKYVML